MFREAAVPCKVTDNLEGAHWEKLVWNIPFNGLGVAAAAGYEAIAHGGSAANPLGECLSTARLLEEARWEKLARELMLEVTAVAEAEGHPLPSGVAERQIERTRSMGAYKASTLLDFEMGRPLELENLFLAPLREAHRLSVATPRLAALCEVLTTLDSATRAGNRH